MNRRSTILAAAGVAAATAILFSGCASATAHPPKPSSRSSTWTDHAATGDNVDAGASTTEAVKDLTWSSGLNLSAAGALPQWVDPLVADPDWTVESPDNGNGTWSYQSTTNSCTLTFYQGAVSDVSPVAGDDQASSTAVLAGIYGDSWSTVSAHAMSYPLGYGAALAKASGVVDGMAVQATGATSASQVWVRTFWSVNITAYNVIQCGTGAELDAASPTLDALSIALIP
ncbi:hypothetical protein [Leifsonia aquatica]|uniref:hypothetical protein n=1 Tax=Leifsonia aquatica TaxID=144185 RepID=UPI003807E0AA